MDMETGPRKPPSHPDMADRPENIRQSFIDELYELKAAISAVSESYDHTYADRLIREGEELLPNLHAAITEKTKTSPIGLMEEMRWEKKRLIEVRRSGGE